MQNLNILGKVNFYIHKFKVFYQCISCNIDIETGNLCLCRDYNCALYCLLYDYNDAVFGLISENCVDAIYDCIRTQGDVYDDHSIIKDQLTRDQQELIFEYTIDMTVCSDFKRHNCVSCYKEIQKSIDNILDKYFITDLGRIIMNYVF